MSQAHRDGRSLLHRTVLYTVWYYINFFHVKPIKELMTEGFSQLFISFWPMSFDSCKVWLRQTIYLD